MPKRTNTILLVHGGLWDSMNANQFWTLTGITHGLHRQGFHMLAPDRLQQPPHWPAEVEHLVAALPDHPVTVVAGSNGCSAAVRLGLAFPRRLARLVLAWPATAGDPVVDTDIKARLTARGTSDQVIRALLRGQTLRGVTDDELSTLPIHTGVLASVPANTVHQRNTVDSLLRLLPDSEELTGCPEPPSPDFTTHLDRFLATITEFIEQ